MKSYSFYAWIAGQVLFVLFLEALTFNNALSSSLTEHIILAFTLFLVTSGTYYVSRKMVVDPHYFIQIVIASTTVKLIIYIGVIFCLIYFLESIKASYLFYFFITYILVTTTEIIFLVKTLRAKQNKRV